MILVKEDVYKRQDLDEDEISDYITDNFEGNSLIAAGDEDLVKIHFHTNEPWKILELSLIHIYNGRDDSIATFYCYSSIIGC